LSRERPFCSNFSARDGDNCRTTRSDLELLGIFAAVMAMAKQINKKIPGAGFLCFSVFVSLPGLPVILEFSVIDLVFLQQRVDLQAYPGICGRVGFLFL